MSNHNLTHPLPETGGDIAVQMWAEACGAEELESLARFLGKQATEEQPDA